MAILPVILLTLGLGAPDPQPSPPPIVILTDTGARREGLPVLQRHPRPAPYEALLTRGYAGRLLRLYRLAQRFAHPERAPQPAYLLLSQNQGGFPRFGFDMDGRRQPGAAYVDLHERSTLSGRAGAIDQIFPHELLHIIVHDLAGEPPEGGANQVHAIGVRTDRITAFNEGFAEHAQVMAIEAEDGAAETRAIAGDIAARDSAFADVARYRRALGARWSIAPRARMTFPFWFSRTEQMLRYHAVRENLFARQPVVPFRLTTGSDVYAWYLIENIVPGEPSRPPKTPSRLLSTEGVVSALFYRFVTAPGIQSAYRGEEFYRRFGTAASGLDAVDNAYLKLFAAIEKGGYDSAAVLRAYLELFPDERPAVMDVVRSTLYTDSLELPPEIWLLNDRFHAGTTLFDQFRGIPRAHTFDLNACSAADLASVTGMTPAASAAILAHSPYATLADLSRVHEVAPSLGAEFARMHDALTAQRASQAEDEASLSIRAILMPYVWRALYVAIASAILAGCGYRLVRRVRWWRLALNGLAVSIAGLIAGWTIDAGSGLLAFAVPALVFGVPAALIAAWRLRSLDAAGRVLAAWALASVVPALMVRPLA